MNQINIRAAQGDAMKASREWMRRPADERFTSLQSLHEHCQDIRDHSVAGVVSSRSIRFSPDPADQLKGLRVEGHNGVPHRLTHWCFGQACQLVKAPARYLRTLPAPMVADLLSYGTQHARDVEDIGVLLDKRDPANPSMRAMTGPSYGRIWNSEVTEELIDQFGRGDGTDGGRWKVPGEFGVDVKVNKQNTTLYAGDQDVFVFLADESRRVEVPNRRNGQPGSLARGFFISNSEVGAGSLGFGVFLFDFACMNRIVWGMNSYHELRIRHTAGAPDRWAEELVPLLTEFADGEVGPIEETIRAAQSQKLAKDEDAVRAFCADRFGKHFAELMAAAHMEEEGRPIETVWDAVTGATAAARDIQWQDQRIQVERLAGSLLDKVAA